MTATSMTPTGPGTWLRDDGTYVRSVLSGGTVVVTVYRVRDDRTLVEYRIDEHGRWSIDGYPVEMPTDADILTAANNPAAWRRY